MGNCFYSTTETMSSIQHIFLQLFIDYHLFFMIPYKEGEEKEKEINYFISEYEYELINKTE